MTTAEGGISNQTQNNWREVDVPKKITKKDSKLQYSARRQAWDHNHMICLMSFRDQAPGSRDQGPETRDQGLGRWVPYTCLGSWS